MASYKRLCSVLPLHSPCQSHVLNISRFATRLNTTSTSPSPSPSSPPTLPSLRRVYDKSTHTVSYVLTSSGQSPQPIAKTSLPPQTALTSIDPSASTPSSNTSQNKPTEPLTNALSIQLPSTHTHNKREQTSKTNKPPTSKKLYSLGASISNIKLKQLNRDYIRDKRNLSSEILSFFETVPKLQKYQSRLTNHDLSKLLTLQQALQISPKKYKTLLSRYPYILKLDIAKEVLPRMKALCEVFPNQDILAIIIRAPNLLAAKPSTWLTRRDKIQNMLGVGKNVWHPAIAKQPSLLFNSIVKTTGPKVRFLCDRVRNKHELQLLLHSEPSILKVSWARLARIEFLRSHAVPKAWQTEMLSVPKDKDATNVLGDVLDDALEGMGEAEGKKKMSLGMARRLEREKERRQQVKEWHLNYPCVKFKHAHMRYVFPKYVRFLEEFTLRAKRSKMWTVSDLKDMKTPELEAIVGEALRRKYARRKVVVNKMDWEKTERHGREKRKAKRVQRRMASTPRPHADRF